MLQAMIITDENLPQIRRMLSIDQLPSHFLDRVTWIVWKNNHWCEFDTAWTMPHKVFKKNYDVVFTDGIIYSVEKSK